MFACLGIVTLGMGLSFLPAIEDSITVDGTTEPDFAGTPIIEIDGSTAGPTNGLDLVGSGITIRGLVVNRFGANGLLIHTDANQDHQQ